MIRLTITHGQDFSDVVEWICTHATGKLEVCADGEHMRTYYNSKPETVNKCLRIVNLCGMAVRSGHDISIRVTSPN